MAIRVALHLAIAALTMYCLARVLGLNRWSSALSAVTYAFSGFMVVSTTFPMVLARRRVAPAILACIELMLRSRKSHTQLLFRPSGRGPRRIQFLAGHVDISIYNLLIAACTLSGERRRCLSLKETATTVYRAGRGAWLHACF